MIQLIVMKILTHQWVAMTTTCETLHIVYFIEFEQHNKSSLEHNESSLYCGDNTAPVTQIQDEHTYKVCTLILHICFYRVIRSTVY